MTKEELQARIRGVKVLNGRALYGPALAEAIMEYAAPLLAAGQSQVQIAGELGIKAFTLQRWHQNARKAAGTKPKAASGRELAFVRLEPARLEARASLEVVVSNRRMVRVPVGFDQATLAQVLTVLEGGAR